MIDCVSISAAGRHGRGFTLMEMMIAMALVGMALTIAFSSLRFASRSWERTDLLMSELDQLRVAGSVVRRQLNQVVAIRPVEASRKLLFSGAPHLLEFVAPAPIQDGRLVALYRYRLRFVAEEQGKMLWLDYRPWLPGEDPGWQGMTESSLLVSGLDNGEFAYLADTPLPDGPHWQAVWDKPERLPVKVRMTLHLQKQSAPWPALVVVLPVTGTTR